MLTLKGIKKIYRLGDEEVQALSGIDLEFRTSEFASILGSSGCGKTTLLNIIGGLDRYDQGDLIINGKSTKDFKEQDWDWYRNKKIGFVFQNYNLLSHLTVLKNVELSLTLCGVSMGDRQQRAIAVLQEVGLEKQMYKKPNQLSGGQMQRVAIARALINNPEILLADEPTGALDTKTSFQIMELIKKIASDRLVVMVTHNEVLAKKYSTRIIKMVDGKIVDDTNPYKSIKKDKGEERVVKKTAMSLYTAISLSFKNLISKKTRTAITAIAGSIGIITMALVLAIMNGTNAYIENLQADTLTSYPIVISDDQVVVQQDGHGEIFFESDSDLDKYPSSSSLLIEKEEESTTTSIANTITDEYVEYISSNIKEDWYNDVMYDTGMLLSVYKENDGQYIKLNTTPKEVTTSRYHAQIDTNPIWQKLLDIDFLSSQYDVLAGEMPKNQEEVVLIVDEYNQISKETLDALGIENETMDTIDFNSLLNTQYSVVTNDQLYTNIGNRFIENTVEGIDFTLSKKIKVVGVIRSKEEAESSILSQGIGYSKKLYSTIQEQNGNSEIVQWIKENPETQPFTGKQILSVEEKTEYEKGIRQIGGDDSFNSIKIYAKDFNSKTLIKESLDTFNEDKEILQQIQYTDSIESLASFMTTIINIISYILIAMTAISLLVSTIMIGIITYVSVIERTKEIGVLRSVGARKKDVARVFMAEACSIGGIAGIIGIGVTLLLSIGINTITSSLLDIGRIANLSWIHAIALLLMSIGLTLISGLIPARIAARKDPVKALRSE